MINNTSFFFLLLLLCTGRLFSQDTAIYNCNVRLITSKPHCDSLRTYKVHADFNSRKMLKRDKQLIAFLNLYHSDTLSLQTLEDQIQKSNYRENWHKHADTSSRYLTIYSKGLTNLMIRYEYNDGRILKRYYQLEINNPSGAAFSRPLDYHYKIFKLLNFCLGRRFSCYNFEDEF